MIYITGDGPGDVVLKRLKKYFKNRYTTDKDYLFVLGGAGIVESEENCRIWDYCLLGPTVFFLEESQLANRFPVVTKFGAKCHPLYRNVFQIIHGELVTVNGLSFLTLGGLSGEEKDLGMIECALKHVEGQDRKIDYLLSPRKINGQAFTRLKQKVSPSRYFVGQSGGEVRQSKVRFFDDEVLEIKSLFIGSHPIAYPVVFERDNFLYNEETRRRIKGSPNDLPEWYYEASGFYYSLRGVTDVAFTRSWTSNHLDKDACVYLHYHGKLKHNDLFEPANREEWDARVYRGYAAEIVLGLEKYSPHLKLDKLKAAVNLNYDHYNQRIELFWFPDSQDIVQRPFPEVKTPHYTERHSREKAQYAVMEGDIVLSEFLEQENAVNYARLYAKSRSSDKSYSETSFDSDSDIISTYDFESDNRARRIAVRRLPYDK